MRLIRTVPALLLALALTACGEDEEPKDSDSAAPEKDALTVQAEAIIECTTDQGLPGELNQTSDGVPAIDLTTEDQTILVHLLESEEEAASYQNGAGLDQEQIDNAVVIGGAISPENRTIIIDCIEAG